MKKILVAALVAAGFPLHVTVALAAAEFKIVTASTRGTYIQIGRDIASFVAPQADIELDVLPSAGSAENVKRLRYEPGVKLAIVQSDVYQAFLDQAAAGNAEASKIIQPLRVVMPLYNEEIYFIVRADSDLHYVNEIKDARINAGELGSGTALTTATLYRLMFNEPIPDARASFFTNEDALVKLITDKHAGAYLYAAPDCPQVYFLSGLRNPTRTFFDFFDDPKEKSDRVQRMLEEREVKVVVINRRPAFSSPMDPKLVAALEIRFPHSQPVGQFVVRWKD